MTTDRQMIAVAEHDGRVSTLFDAAPMLRVIAVSGEPAGGPQTRSLAGLDTPGRIALVAETGAAVLICGAISGYAANALAGRGIDVIPWACGPVDEVVAAYLGGTLAGPAWTMPGARCAGPRGYGRGGRGRGGRGRGRRGRRW